MSAWTTIRDSAGKAIVLGRTTKANSLPVTIASDQDPIAPYRSTRRPQGAYKVLQNLAATALPVTPTIGNGFLSNPLYVTRWQILSFLLEATVAVTGTPSGVSLWVKQSDGFGGMVDVIGSPFPLTLVSPQPIAAAVLSQALQVTDMGRLIQVGLSATTPYTGGTLQLSLLGIGV